MGRSRAQRSALDALARLADDLRANLEDQPITLSWVHGDYAPNNILSGSDGQVSGIVDWEFGYPEDFPSLDVVTLLLTARMFIRRQRLGRIVSEARRRSRHGRPTKPGSSPLPMMLVPALRSALRPSSCCAGCATSPPCLLDAPATPTTGCGCTQTSTTFSTRSRRRLAISSMRCRAGPSRDEPSHGVDLWSNRDFAGPRPGRLCA